MKSRMRSVLRRIQPLYLLLLSLLPLSVSAANEPVSTGYFGDVAGRGHDVTA